MDDPMGNYTRLRMQATAERLERNNFEVFLAKDAAEARRIVLEAVVPEVKPASVSWGGSLTLDATGLKQDFAGMDGVEVLDASDKKLSAAEKHEVRRRALLVDLFFTGANALTETGTLVNLDMHGNRVAAMCFGPKNVVVLVSASKIVSDLDEAMYRIKNFAAPVNTMRLNMKTPCVKSSFCEDCRSKERICNVWTINDKSFPKKRIKVVLIEERLGF